jgi:metallo-beta-lactamase class B
MSLRALLLLFCFALPAAAQDDIYRKPFPAFKVIGNVYWVGTWDLSTYLIATPQGHILINTGFIETTPLILEGIEKLGFKIEDVKVLLTTHAHFDHVAGLAELKRRSGAQLMAMDAEVELLESGGKTDFRFGDQPNTHFEPVHVDRRFKDGDTITLGGVTLTAHHHPGHTKGATSYTFTVNEGGRDYRVIIANMGGINPGVKVSGMPKYPSIAADYERTFAAQKRLDIDVFLASHAAQFGLHDKYQSGDPYDPNRFVDAPGYRAGVERAEARFREQLASERSGAAQPAP